MDTADLTAMLNPRDRKTLDEHADISWVPKDPREILAPYMEDPLPDKMSIDFRREKAKEVYDGYGELIEKCKGIREEIEKQCKNVKVTLNPGNNLRVIEAVRRVFGTDGTEITFQMYQKAVEMLAKISSDAIPDPNHLTGNI